MATQQLATLTDLVQNGVAASAFPASITDAIKNDHLVKASGLALSYVAKHYGLPLVSWGDDLRGAVVAIATYTLLRLRGFNPENPADRLVIKSYDDAILWLRDVSKGLAELVDIVDASTATDEGAPLVESDTRAEWTWATTSDEDDEDL